MFSKYRTAILVLSILLLVYALHLFPTSSIHNVSALLTDSYVEVFWDRNCTQGVSSIDWGSLAPGETKTVSVYVQSKSNETCILILMPTGWNPPAVANYLELSQDYENKKIQPNEVVRVTQSLTVSPNIAGITNFSFNIIVQGSKYLLGDINGDGIVEMMDFFVLCAHFDHTPPDGHLPDKRECTECFNADVNDDGIVEMMDFFILSQHFGQHYP